MHLKEKEPLRCTVLTHPASLEPASLEQRKEETKNPPTHAKESRQTSPQRKEALLKRGKQYVVGKEMRDLMYVEQDFT